MSRPATPLAVPLGRRAALGLARRRVAGRRAPLVVVDGASGAGKSTFADRLVAAWPGSAPTVLRLDAAVPGWEGLEAGVAAVGRALRARADRHGAAAVPLWDWVDDRPGPRLVLPPGALVVEGCGAFAAAGGVDALRIWVELPDDDRRRRALERDDGAYDPFWPVWERQRRRHVRRAAPAASADLRVRTPSL